MNTKTKLVLMEVIKWLFVLVVVVFLLSRVTGNRQSAAPFESVSGAVTSAADLSNMQEADHQMVKRLYGLNPSDYEGILLYTPTTNMGAEEILLVKLADTAQQDAVVSAIESRVATQMDSFEGYAVTQYEMLQNSVTEVRGNYILLVVAADTTPVVQAFTGAL